MEYSLLHFARVHVVLLNSSPVFILYFIFIRADSKGVQKQGLVSLQHISLCGNDLLAKDLTKLSLLPSIETVDFTGCGFIANKNLAGLKRAIAERKPNTFFEIVNSKKILVRQRSKEPMQSAIVMGANMLEGELWSSDQFIAFLRQSKLTNLVTPALFNYLCS